MREPHVDPAVPDHAPTMWESDRLAQVMEPAVAKLFRFLRRSLSEAGKAHQLTFTQANALRFLLAGGDKRMSELAARLELSNSACTAMVDQLEKRRLVTKTLDPDDRRSNLVSLSRDGTVMAEAMVAAMYTRLADAMKRLSVPERYMVLGAFEALAQVIVDPTSGPARSNPRS